MIPRRLTDPQRSRCEDEFDDISLSDGQAPSYSDAQEKCISNHEQDEEEE